MATQPTHIDTEVYNTHNQDTYVIQFETENKTWQDASVLSFWSKEAALKHLQEMIPAASYPYRIVRRRKGPNVQLY